MAWGEDERSRRRRIEPSDARQTYRGVSIARDSGCKRLAGGAERLAAGGNKLLIPPINRRVKRSMMMDDWSRGPANTGEQNKGDASEQVPAKQRGIQA